MAQPKYIYKVTTNSGWSYWWRIFDDYEKDTQNHVDKLNSQGWDLHSFSLRNSMLPNASLGSILIRLLISIVTLGFVSYGYGGVWVFRKELQESLKSLEK